MRGLGRLHHSCGGALRGRAGSAQTPVLRTDRLACEHSSPISLGLQLGRYLKRSWGEFCSDTPTLIRLCWPRRANSQSRFCQCETGTPNLANKYSVDRANRGCCVYPGADRRAVAKSPIKDAPRVRPIGLEHRHGPGRGNPHVRLGTWSRRTNYWMLVTLKLVGGAS